MNHAVTRSITITKTKQVHDLVHTTCTTAIAPLLWQTRRSDPAAIATRARP